MIDETRPRFSYAGARAWLAVAAVLVLVATPRCLRFYDTALYHAPEPAGWSSWPMGAIDQRHTRFCDENGCGLRETRYEDYKRLVLFHAPGTDVYVDGRMAHTGGHFGTGPTRPQFDVAWRLVKDRWIAFESPRAEVVFATVALEFALIAGLVVVRRRLGVAARLADTLRAA